MMSFFPFWVRLLFVSGFVFVFGFVFVLNRSLSLKLKAPIILKFNCLLLHSIWLVSLGYSIRKYTLRFIFTKLFMRRSFINPSNIVKCVRLNRMREETVTRGNKWHSHGRLRHLFSSYFSYFFFPLRLHVENFITILTHSPLRCGEGRENKD